MNKNRQTYSVWNIFIRLIRLGKKYIHWYLFLSLTTVIASSIGVLNAEAFRRMANGATESNMSLLLSGTYLAIAAAVISIVINWIVSYLGQVVNLKSVVELQSRIMSKLMKVKMIDYNLHHSGDLIARINSAAAAQRGINQNIQSVLQNILTFIFFISYLSFLEWRLTLGSLSIGILFPILTNMLSSRLRKAEDDLQVRKSEKDAFIQDVVKGGEIVRSFSIASELNDKFLEKFNLVLEATRRKLLYSTIINQSSFFRYLGVIFILIYGGFLVIEGDIKVGGVVAFTVSFGRMVGPVSRLSQVWSRFQTSISNANRVFEILELPEENFSIRDKENISVQEEPYLKFDRVSFRYPSGKEVLSELSFSVKKAETISFVGTSGSGKSTLLKLLLRLYEPNSGEIMFQEEPIFKIPIEKWRKKIAYVPQEPYLFSGSFFDNIRYGNMNATKQQIIEAAQIANIHQFIKSTDKEYDTKIGEQGIRISGGQRQRIAIARAILQKPDILLLDEPVASLDSENELLIQNALENAMKGRTVIVASHRISTVRNSDRIIVIDKGKVEEIGTHKELMERRSRYREIALSELYDTDTVSDSS